MLNERDLLSRLEWWFAVGVFVGLLLLFSTQLLLLTRWGRYTLGVVDRLEGAKVESIVLR